MSRVKIPVVPFGQRTAGDSHSPTPEHRAVIADALARLGRVAAAEPEAVPESVINFNYQVETRDGPLFVRIHRKTRQRERLELEQAAQRWAGERGVPVVAPLADANGETIWSRGGVLFSVYPFVEGTTLRRGDIDREGAVLLGELHGRLHKALSDFEHPALAPSPQLQWDTETSIAELSRVDDLIRYYPAPGEERLRAQRNLRIQLELLESGIARPPGDFAYFPLQPVHGDYHERNVIVATAHGPALAVVDWEMAALMAPITELMRALDFVGLLGTELMRAYLAAYAREASIPRDLCVDVVEQWWQQRLHNTWAFRRVFIEGDQRAAQFFDNIGVRLQEYREPTARRAIADALLEFAT